MPKLQQSLFCSHAATIDPENHLIIEDSAISEELEVSLNMFKLAPYVYMLVYPQVLFLIFIVVTFVFAL